MEVAEGSEDARKWPLWDPSTTLESTPEATTASNATDRATAPPTPIPALAPKKPGRRRPRVQLGDIPSTSAQKAKKLTTIEKSAMDWRAHSQDDAQLKDELDANRRGGGYLEKVEFLQRVEQRKDEAFEANKSNKRRRG